MRPLSLPSPLLCLLLLSGCATPPFLEGRVTIASDCPSMGAVPVEVSVPDTSFMETWILEPSNDGEPSFKMYIAHFPAGPFAISAAVLPNGPNRSETLQATPQERYMNVQLACHGLAPSLYVFMDETAWVGVVAPEYAAAKCRCNA